MTLSEAREGQSYTVERIDSGDEEMEAFLFSLGCYSGESITVISQLHQGCVAAIKGGRYTIDRQLAKTIFLA